MPFLDISELYLWYEDAGPRDAPVVLLVHGAGGSLKEWDALAAALAGEFRVVRLDLPGRGEPPAPADTAVFEFDRLAALLAELLDALDIERAYLCGHGIGGLLALLMTLSAPERAAGLILAGTAPQPLPDALRLALRPEPGAGPAPAGLAGLRKLAEGVKPMLASYPPIEPGSHSGEAAQAAHDPSQQAMLARWAAFDGVVDRLEAITIETLVLVGEGDAPFTQEGAELLHGWMPFSRLVRVPESGFRPHAENPSAFDEEVLAFLREVEGFRRDGNRL